METKESRVTFEQAYLLQQHGFNWEVSQGFYKHNKEEYNHGVEDDLNDSVNLYSRPTISHALMFYREVKGIMSAINLHQNKEYWLSYTINGRVYQSSEAFSQYQEAESALLNNIQKLVEEWKY